MQFTVHEPVQIVEHARAWSGVGVGSMVVGGALGFALPSGQGFWVLLTSGAVSAYSFVKSQIIQKGELAAQKDKLAALELHVADRLKAVTDQTGVLQRGHERIEGKVDEILKELKSTNAERKSTNADRSRRNTRDESFQNDVREHMGSLNSTPDPDAMPVHKPEHMP